MAYTFNGSTQLLEVASAVATAVPITMATFFNTSSTSIMGLVGLANSTETEQRFQLELLNTKVTALMQSSVAFDQVSATIDYTTGALGHAAAVFAATNDTRAFFNGANKGTGTTSVTPNTQGRTAIGVLVNGAGNSSFYDGALAELAIWTAALTDAEIAWLALGNSPLTLTHRIGDLVLYRDLIRELNRPYIGPALTNTNGATVSNHPPIRYPSPVIIGIPVAVAGAAAIMNQIQDTNMGADLFNGTIQ